MPFIANTGCAGSHCTMWYSSNIRNVIVFHPILHCQFPFEIRRKTKSIARHAKGENMESSIACCIIFLIFTYELLARYGSIFFFHFTRSFFQLRIQRTVGYETEEQSFGEFFIVNILFKLFGFWKSKWMALNIGGEVPESVWNWIKKNRENWRNVKIKKSSCYNTYM